eukprot:5605945-Pleurochrysis_carterae.AAC.1
MSMLPRYGQGRSKPGAFQRTRCIPARPLGCAITTVQQGCTHAQPVSIKTSGGSCVPSSPSPCDEGEDRVYE